MSGVPIPARPRGRHRLVSTAARRLTLLLTTAAVLVGSGTLVAHQTQSASAATTTTTTTTTTKPIVFGASGGDQVAKLSTNIGAPLGKHVYAKLNGPVLDGRMINIATNVPWRTVASAKAGSATYNDLVRWADTLKQRQGPILVAFSHEPEGKSSAREKLGTAAEFIAAWRKVHDVFQARGVRNVEYTWTMTSNAFRVKPGDARYAPKWYPGDAYVDNVATAAYNWYTCGEGNGQWLSLQNRAAAPLAFAKAHKKGYVLAEWASQKDARRAQWLKDARSFMLANASSIRGAFYYQSPTPRPGCSWMLTTSAEFTAFGQMAKDRTDFGG
ncbi:MAG TPA: glycosyl hydrolase [Actinomycetales bacterium]|nr:glycosyl hydrolase [Actinomycetales bacterium]